MPVAVSYPGVYLQEVPSGVHTITGVSTSIAAFLGRTADGPIDEAKRCLSFADFLRQFGGPHPSSDLARSVRQFFDNGGTDCYVVRLAHNARKADITLRNLAGVSVLQATAKNAGTRGNSVCLEVDYRTNNPEESFNLTVLRQDDAGGTLESDPTFANLSMNPLSPRYAPAFVTQSSKLIDLALAGGFNIDSTPVVGYSEGRRPFDITTATFAGELNNIIYPTAPGAIPLSRLAISINDGPYSDIDLQKDPTPFTGALAAITTQLTNKINALLPPGVSVLCSWELVHNTFRVFRISSAVGKQVSVRIRSASANDLAKALMLGIDQGGIEVTRYSNHRPVPTATFYSASVNTLAALTQDAVNKLTFTAPLPNLVDFTLSGPNVLQTTASTDRWYRDALASAVNNHNDGVREKLSIMEREINKTPGMPARAEVWGYRLALIPKSGTINSTIVFTTGPTDISGSFTPNVKRYCLGNTGTSASQAGAGAVGRDDDGNPPSVADYSGDALGHTGFYALDKVDLFNLMVLPGDQDVAESVFTQLVGPASVYCNDHRAFLLLDAPASWTSAGLPNANASVVNAFRNLTVKDHSAVFYPRVEYSDAGIRKLIGPTGIIAGLIARTDAQRGVWKAPAGTEAALFAVLDLEVNLTDLENGVLNKLGVNCLRKFPTGIVNWGARTLDGSDDIGSEWKYIPIRRLALFLEESLFRGTKWVVFEPNDEPLWASIRLNLNAFMLSLFRQGAFQGSTPDKAFYVKCDGETTTQNDRNLGIVNIEVGFAPLKPAEFVIIKIQQIAGDLT
ncbi:MAG TPA: phage tail sheath C-terminal domain-containing protein [Gemmatimonadaceae bacterium]|nr:phage tail sheath C-terminal domain-containing protein [Gemmatimonadaceae bacterium]